MEIEAKHMIALETVIAGLKSESRVVQTLSGSLPVGPLERAALAKIADDIRYRAESIEALVRELKGESS
jgi:hypothetical protein